MIGFRLSSGGWLSTARVRGVALIGGALGCVALGCGALGCGGAQQKAAEASEPEAAPEAAPESPPEAATPAPPEPSGLPTACQPEGELCLPPRAFVKRLCQDAYSGAAIRLFEKSSPFSRGYVTGRKIQAVNTLGGPASDVSLDAGEEVVILLYRGGPAATEMQVSGMGGYDVLRWDGTCATLSDGELALRPPRAPRHGPLDWRYIDTNIQKALLENADIGEARREQRKHCHGVSVGRVSAACAKADARFYERLAATVRGGIELPEPERLP